MSHDTEPEEEEVDLVEVWRKLTDGKATSWVLFEYGTCVMLPDAAPANWEAERDEYADVVPIPFFPDDLQVLDMTDGGFAWTRRELEDAVNTAYDWLDAA